MKSAKEFAAWLVEQLKDQSAGVYLTREDIKQLTGRLSYRSDFINDIHYELVCHGMGFVSDIHRNRFYLVHLPQNHWQQSAADSESEMAPPPAANERHGESG